MGRTWQLLLKVLIWQLAFGGLVALIITVMWTKQHGWSFFVGVASMASGLLCSARIALRPADSPAASLAKTFSAVLFRWLWVVTCMYYLVAVWRWPALPALIGVIVAELCFIALGARNQPTSR